MIELNNIVPLFPGIHGGYIKVVGTSFKDERTLLKRRTLIKEFFERHPSKSTYSRELGKFFSDINGGNIEEINNVGKNVRTFLRVERELDNIYDSNALVVCIYLRKVFLRIGYIPRNLAKDIVSNNFEHYVIGVEKDGRGMILTMVFKSPEILVSKPSPVFSESNKNESLGFMSLNKIRKKLCK